MQAVKVNTKGIFPRLSGFLDWWTGELLDLIPAYIKNVFRVNTFELQIDLSSDEICLVNQTQGNIIQRFAFDSQTDQIPHQLTTLLEQYSSHGLQTVLLLKKDDVLFLEVILPAAAEENLNEVLGYEMDRQTPFKIEQVFYAYEVQKDPQKPDHIKVSLIVVPRELVMQWSKKLENWQLPLSTVSIAEKSPGDTRFNLLPTQLRFVHSQGIAQINRILILSAMVMLTAAIFIHMARQDELIDYYENQITAVSEEVRQVQNLKKDIDQLIKDSQKVISLKQNAPSTMEILNELTLLIPEHTWISRFELLRGKINLQGESSNASELIGLIEASKVFKNATFSSPVVRDAKTGFERFQIMVNLTEGDDS